MEVVLVNAVLVVSVVHVLGVGGDHVLAERVYHLGKSPHERAWGVGLGDDLVDVEGVRHVLVRLAGDVVLRDQPADVPVLGAHRVRPYERQHHELVEVLAVRLRQNGGAEPVDVEQDCRVEHEPRYTVADPVPVLLQVEGLHDLVVIEVVALVPVVVLDVSKHVEVVLRVLEEGPAGDDGRVDLEAAEALHAGHERDVGAVHRVRVGEGALVVLGVRVAVARGNPLEEVDVPLVELCRPLALDPHLQPVEVLA